ncbi:uncharacterized protein LOC131195642 isoform X2 [Ahaetulla prasina]|uniref:uncharacterized protein LOC131195642 isoform X2 n=1 Tax=Ahaetulla prasina TaxID=499056 RepID=UPI002648EB95|nr:uncharacterized protein LOC131195642 isoform X2 [Ahaetulla prasina]
MGESSPAAGKKLSARCSGRKATWRPWTRGRYQKRPPRVALSAAAPSEGEKRSQSPNAASAGLQERAPSPPSPVWRELRVGSGGGSGSSPGPRQKRWRLPQPRTRPTRAGSRRLQTSPLSPPTQTPPRQQAEEGKVSRRISRALKHERRDAVRQVLTADVLLMLAAEANHSEVSLSKRTPAGWRRQRPKLTFQGRMVGILFLQWSRQRRKKVDILPHQPVFFSRRMPGLNCLQ